jgi:hypothetical protein
MMLIHGGGLVFFQLRCEDTFIVGEAYSYPPPGKAQPGPRARQTNNERLSSRLVAENPRHRFDLARRSEVSAKISGFEGSGSTYPTRQQATVQR